MKYLSNLAPSPFPPFPHSLILIVMLLCLCPVNTQDLIVEAKTTSINSLSNYVFYVNGLTYSVEAGATIAITFPPEYSADALHNMAPYSGYDAGGGDACWPSGLCSVTITFSGSTLFLAGLFPSAYDHTIDFYFLQFTVFSLQNPDSLSVGFFPMTIFKGSSIYYPPSTGSSSSTPTFTASTMTYSTQIQQGSIWATSPLTISLTPDTLLDTLNFNFPTSWTN